jgi:hypothetical protein
MEANASWARHCLTLAWQTHECCRMLVEIQCARCSSCVFREAWFLKRAQRRGARLFCGRRCSALSLPRAQPGQPVPKECLVCGSAFVAEDPRTKCCSPACGKKLARRTQAANHYEAYIAAWKAGKVDGNKGVGFVSNHVRRYLFSKYESRCMECGWRKKHPVTGKVPLEVDHVDGDWRNSSEGNLRLLCPNDHSLTPTYRNLNSGKGRPRRGNPIGDGA